MSTLMIKNLQPRDIDQQDEQAMTVRSLSPEELRKIRGGAYAVGMLNGDDNNLVSFDADKWNFEQFMRGAL